MNLTPLWLIFIQKMNTHHARGGKTKKSSLHYTRCNTLMLVKNVAPIFATSAWATPVSGETSQGWQAVGDFARFDRSGNRTQTLTPLNRHYTRDIMKACH